MNTTDIIVEDVALAWLEARGCEAQHGPEIAIGMPGAERSDSNYRAVMPETLIPGELPVVNADQFLREAV